MKKSPTNTPLDELSFIWRPRVHLIAGVNTNSCVLATTTSANVRDYAVIVVEDSADLLAVCSM